MTEVPYVTVGELTEAQRRAYILADNRLAEDGAWDMGKLRFEMEALNDLAFDVSVTGFEMDEVVRFYPRAGHAARSRKGHLRWRLFGFGKGRSGEEGCLHMGAERA